MADFGNEFGVALNHCVAIDAANAKNDHSS